MKKVGQCKEKVSNLTVQKYFSETLQLFVGLESYHTDHLLLAGRKIQLRTPSMLLNERMLPSLAHMLTTSTLEPDLVIWYAEDKDLPEKLKAPPWHGFNAQGINMGMLDNDIQIFFQPWQHQIFLYSRSQNIGIYWVRRVADLPWWECTFSFRAIFHFWTADLTAQLVHAGAIGDADNAILITGKSGSGKSTSCLNLMKAGYQYLGDDYVWIELDKEPSVHTLYRTAKLEPENLHARFSEWKSKVVNPETYHEEKAIFHIDQLYSSALVTNRKLKAIILPTVMHQNQSSVTRVPATEALMAMAPTTLHHLPHNRGTSYKKLMQISASLPSFKWELGTEEASFLQTFSKVLNEN